MAAASSSEVVDLCLFRWYKLIFVFILFLYLLFSFSSCSCQRIEEEGVYLGSAAEADHSIQKNLKGTNDPAEEA
jgi:hypothetical protein